MPGRKSEDSNKGKRKVLKPLGGAPERKFSGPKPAGRPASGRPKPADKPSGGRSKRAQSSEGEERGHAGTRGGKRFVSDKPRFDKPKAREKSSFEKKYGKPEREKPAYGAKDKPRFTRRPPRSNAPVEKRSADGTMRLNKFLSNAGIASRRDADKLIELGLVTVNGKVVTELGIKVDPRKDVVRYDDRSLKPEPFRYVLLNKPKDYITTMDDPGDRKTVMSLVESACKERIYPVGRLDRQTTGLLLFTNDGDLAKRLTHPKHEFSKLYHVETAEKVSGAHLDAIREGIKLEDGLIKADEISFVNDDPKHVGIRIHSGKNRIVRRIFEHFGYTVKKLDRVMFAGLTKKDLSRGRFRHLTETEVNFLKMIR